MAGAERWRGICGLGEQVQKQLVSWETSRRHLSKRTSGEGKLCSFDWGGPGGGSKGHFSSVKAADKPGSLWVIVKRKGEKEKPSSGAC